MLIEDARLAAGRRQPQAAAEPDTDCISTKAATRRPQSAGLRLRRPKRYKGHKGAPAKARCLNLLTNFFDRSNL